MKILSDRVFSTLSIEGFFGRAGNARVFSLSLPASRSIRRLVSVVPSISYQLTDRVGLDLGAGLPVMGRNYSAGRLFTLGMSFGNTKSRFGGGNHLPSPRGGSCCAIQ